jgi:hypothetical protein
MVARVRLGGTVWAATVNERRIVAARSFIGFSYEVAR